jgi:hypothetical protein
MIGSTRSRVSFFMNKFRKLGFISYNGKIEVHHSLLNAVLYDRPGMKKDQARAQGSLTSGNKILRSSAGRGGRSRFDPPLQADTRAPLSERV